MRPAARALAVALLAALPALGGAGMNVSLNSDPSSVIPGQLFTVTLIVQNNSSTNDLSSVVPDLGIVDSGFGPVLIAGPSPASQSIPHASNANFVWTFSGSACGDVRFTASASGVDTLTTGPVSSGDSAPRQVFIVCSPTPTPTVTPVLTPTATPWVVYGTPTPGPSEANAYIPGNLYHPLQGGLLQLRYDAPLEGRMQVDLYDRLGHRVKHFERSVQPGSYAELWDGRSDDGLLVAAGIYVAHFRGNGLSRIVKFAVIK